MEQSLKGAAMRDAPTTLIWEESASDTVPRSILKRNAARKDVPRMLCKEESALGMEQRRPLAVTKDATT